jgi:hypothetical protein
MDAPASNRRRWIYYNLAFAVVEIAICVRIWSQYRTVRARQRLATWVESHEGNYESVEEWNRRNPPEMRLSTHVPVVRRWLGDRAAANVALPFGSTPEDLDHARILFPEAPHVKIYLHRTGKGIM